MYEELAAWFHLVTAPEEYAGEAEEYRRLLTEACEGQAETLLELGSGGGNNASHYKRHFRATLVNLSPRMLATCDHHECGVFPRATWRRLLGQAGLADVVEPGPATFLARKP